MRILQLGKFYPVRGGVEKVMWDLTRGLADRYAAGRNEADGNSVDGRTADITCDMLCAMLPEDGFDEADGPLAASREGDWPRILQFAPGFRCICVKALAKKASTMISPAMVRYLRRHASEYDIIHIHHPDPMACLALRLSGYKGRVFLHWHSDILSQKTLLRLYMPLQTWMLKRAERIIGTTPVYVRESPYLRPFLSKVCCLPIGIEDNLRPVSGGTPERSGNVRIFSLGRLVEYKGYRYLVEAAGYLPDDYEIRIGGDGPLRSELQAQIDEGNLPVRLLGRLSDAQVREEMNGCDIFALPSVMKTEAFGIVQVEAMSCSKPVVATDIPGSGTGWVNAHGESGLNVPPRDAEALGAAIVSLAADKESFGRRARLRYENIFTLDSMLDSYMEMI